MSGKIRLEIEYSAPFNQALEGLYKVSESGNDYAFTQFEAISARLAFPGFDEPGFKTPFTTTLIVPENQVAISNAPEVSSEIIDGMKHVHFAPTKPLPTYLIAFAVGDFDVVEAPDLPPNEVRDRPLPLRGIAVKGKGEQLAYALEGTNAIVTALESYFGTPYPWAKLDILAVPDFNAGAMENAGAITYRETLLLFDDTRHSGTPAPLQDGARARTGAPVVWRSRHTGLVERHLAQRILRHLDGPCRHGYGGARSQLPP